MLHFCHAEPYPILDVRALWSLGVDASTVPYSFEFWWEYTSFCRELAEEAGRGKSIRAMRELDRALRPRFAGSIRRKISDIKER